MLSIPPAIAELLKSKMMVGANRPTGVLNVDGTLGSGDALPTRAIRFNDGYLVAEDQLPWGAYSWYKADWSNGFVCELPGGKILTTYRNPDTSDHMISVLDDWDELLGGNNRAAQYEYVFKNGPPGYQIPFVAPADGEVYLLDIQNPRSYGISIPCEINLYKSPDKGLGQTWTWQALLYSASYASHVGDYGLAAEGHILISGNDILVPFLSIVDKSGYGWGVWMLLYSRDGGVTWATSSIYAGTGAWTGSTHAAEIPSIWKMGSRYYITNYISMVNGYWLFCYSDNLINWTVAVYNRNDLPADWRWVGTSGTLAHDFIVLGDSKTLYLFISTGPDNGVFKVYTRPATPAIDSGTDFLDITKWTLAEAGAPWAQQRPDDWRIRTFVSNNEVIHLLLERTIFAGGSAFVAKGWEVDPLPPVTPKSITVDRSKGSASQATIVLDNKDGIYSPDKLGDWNKVLWLNKEISIHMGYGSQQQQVFTGLIDEIQMSSYPAELTITARDYSKRALDQQPQRVVDDVTYFALLFEDTTPEAIFTELATMAGWGADKIHADVTGATIQSIQFGHESIADCFQRLAELVSWEWFCDEDGHLYFRAAKDPEAAAVYEFTEGVDIFGISYRISDAELYRTVVAWASTEEGGVVKASTTWAAADYNNLLPLRTLIINAADLATTQEGCQAIADKASNALTPKVREVNFVVVGNPYLQIGDVVKVKETTTTISELYRILEISHQMDAEGSPVFATALRCYHFGAEEEGE